MEFFIKGALAPTIDTRDYKIIAMSADYPDSYTIDFIPKVKNQKTICSCVAHAMSSILEYFNYKETNENISLSTDFIYGIQGIIFNRTKPGMYLRDACKIVREYGDCLKSTIPTNIEQPNCTKNLQKILTDTIYQEAKIFQVDSYARCKSNTAIKHALMNYGPVLASVKWYDENSINNNKVITMNTKSAFGYHAIMIYGWNEYGWLCQNSWGKNWNGDGRFIYPFNSPIAEAWSFVDKTNSDVVIPKNNLVFNRLYKIINLILNLLKRFIL